MGAKRAIFVNNRPAIGGEQRTFPRNLSAREICGHFIHSNNRLAYIYIRESEINTLKLGDPRNVQKFGTNVEKSAVTSPRL